MHVTWNFCLNLIRHLNNHNYTCLRCLRELWGAQLTTWFSLSLDYWWVFCAWFVALNCYVNLMDWSIVRVRVYFIALTLLESLYVICKMWCVKYEMWIVTSAQLWIVKYVKYEICEWWIESLSCESSRSVVNRVVQLWIESLSCESSRSVVNVLWIESFSCESSRSVVNVLWIESLSCQCVWIESLSCEYVVTWCACENVKRKEKKRNHGSISGPCWVFWPEKDEIRPTTWFMPERRGN